MKWRRPPGTRIGLVVVLAGLSGAEALTSIYAQSSAISKDQLYGVWETPNAPEPFDGKNPSLKLHFSADGKVTSDEGTDRECSGVWQLEGSNIITTVVTNKNFRFIDRIVEFNQAKQILVIESEPYGYQRFYLGRPSKAKPASEVKPFTMLSDNLWMYENPRTKEQTFSGHCFVRVSSLPDKMLGYSVRYYGHLPKLLELSIYNIRTDAEARLILRDPPDDAQQIERALDSAGRKVFPGNTVNSDSFFAGFSSLMPKFREWAEKAKQLKPEAFSKRIYGDPKKDPFVFDFVWDGAAGASLAPFVPHPTWAEMEPDRVLSEEDARVVDIALSFKKQVFDELLARAKARGEEKVKHQELVESAFTLDNPPATKQTSGTPQRQNFTNVRYRARINMHDLRNSKGVFLPDVPNIKARDILLQDRFNYHQAGLRDPEDTDDGLYEEGKETMRKAFEGKAARLAEGGDPMPLLSSQPVINVTLMESEIIITPVE